MVPRPATPRRKSLSCKPLSGGGPSVIARIEEGKPDPLVGALLLSPVNTAPAQCPGSPRVEYVL
jgi:hypothetical protein